jgi:hypothetical protein
MFRSQRGYCTAFLLLSLVPATGASQTKRSVTGVQLVSNEAAHRVDVLIDGHPFTSYVWSDSIKKPVLYPLRTAKGTIVTRGYPLDPRPGERVDHPHQVGTWFTYGDVNGLDFWNNSEAIKTEERSKYGTIHHGKIKSVRSGKAQAELGVEMDWLRPDGAPLLREETTFVFHGGPASRAIDRITRLTALEKRVVFNDNKEGVIGIRVARQLEQPSDKPEVFTDASGKATAVPKLDNTGVTGSARRQNFSGECDYCHSRSSEESGVSNLLACARVRVVCGKSTRAESVQRWKTNSELHAGASSVCDVQVSDLDSFRRRHAG